MRHVQLTADVRLQVFLTGESCDVQLIERKYLGYSSALKIDTIELFDK